jgi:hypothetical protein
MKSIIFSAMLMLGVLVNINNNVHGSDENDNEVNVEALAESITNRLSNVVEEQLTYTCSSFGTPGTCLAHITCRWINSSHRCANKPITSAPTTKACITNVCVSQYSIRKCVQGKLQPVESCGNGYYCAAHLFGNPVCICNEWPAKC